jgi:8-oxo-dGTP pyrophosphatase MutT (NUDIX family)
MDSAHPIDSATVIVLRDAGPACEVLLVKRHAQSRAFGGAHVFPGGVVDTADAARGLHTASARVSREAAAARLGESSEGAAALAFWIAAIRELFEEAGILLAEIDGIPPALGDPAVRARFHGHRTALLAGHLTFADLVARERLELATDTLEYWSRWITPVTAPRRYDARFFIARVPSGQEPMHDDRETVATVWLTPSAALAQARARRMVLAPPTVRTLEDLATLGSVSAIFASAAGRVITPILPKTVEIGGRVAVLYPGDADYEDAMPGARLDDTPAGRCNRVVMDDDGWRSIRTPE